MPFLVDSVALAVFCILGMYMVFRFEQPQKRWVGVTGTIGGLLSVSSAFLATFVEPERGPFAISIVLMYAATLCGAIGLLVFCIKQNGNGKISALILSIGGILIAFANGMLSMPLLVDKKAMDGPFLWVVLGAWGMLVIQGLLFALVSLGRKIWELRHNPNRRVTTSA